MKKSRNNGNKWIVIAVVICLVFAAGIGIGTFISSKTAKNAVSTVSKDAAQNGSNTVKNDTAINNTSGKDSQDKDNADSAADDGKNNDTDAKTDSKADADNQTDASKNNANNGQSNSQGGSSTYDASIPDDDTSIHRYEYFVEDCTWQEAFQNCIDKGGYLARINSSKEYETIRKGITSQKLTNIYFRLGGRRDSQSQDYYWVNEDNKLFGEKLNSDSSWCSDEWMKGEPSFKDGSLEEKYMDLFFFDGEKRFVWNDVPDDMLVAEPAYSGIIGYICEYED